MKKVLLLAAVMAAAAPACAEWTLLGEAETTGKWFIDKATIRPSSANQSRRAWVVNEHTKPSEFGRSVRALYEADCSEERVRILQFTYYKGRMGTGQVGVSSEGPLDWEFASPGTVVHTVMQAICL